MIEPWLYLSDHAIEIILVTPSLVYFPLLYAVFQT